jgi:hypothetical protein
VKTHGEVLDDEPADGNVAALGFDQPPFLQSPQKHHGAGDRERQPKHEPRPHCPAQKVCQPQAHQRCDGDLAQGARDRDGPHREKVREREVQPDAEHQQDDADLSQLQRQSLVGHVPWRERPDQDAGDEVADQRREAQAVGQGPEQEGQAEAHDDGSDERRVMRHDPPLGWDRVIRWRATCRRRKSALTSTIMGDTGSPMQEHSVCPGCPPSNVAPPVASWIGPRRSLRKRPRCPGAPSGTLRMVVIPCIPQRRTKSWKPWKEAELC